MPFRTPGTDRGAVTLTDGGLETDLIFNAGIDLPLFAAFPLLDDPDGRVALEGYYRRAIRTAAEAGTAFSLDTVTWRSNPDWAARLGYEGEERDRVDRDAVAFALTLRDAVTAEGAGVPILVCGVIGPRDDGYDPHAVMEPEEARAYHRRQVEVLAGAGVDYVAAMTMTTVGEGAGIALAARDAGVPAVISFTVETDGALPDGTSLRHAIEAVDAAADTWPAYFGVNCAHPSHLPGDLDRQWAQRISVFRANASRRSHAELDEAAELDAGDPAELGAEVAALLARMPQLTVVGGCCGTDDRHIRAIAAALRAAASPAGLG